MLTRLQKRKMEEELKMIRKISGEAINRAMLKAWERKEREDKERLKTE
jgi:hypothetical protein